MTVLEIDDYDEIRTADRLFANVKKAMTQFKVVWHTVDEQEIKRLVRYCIIREFNQLECRKNAKEY